MRYFCPSSPSTPDPWCHPYWTVNPRAGGQVGSLPFLPTSLLSICQRTSSQELHRQNLGGLLALPPPPVHIQSVTESCGFSPPLSRCCLPLSDPLASLGFVSTAPGTELVSDHCPLSRGSLHSVMTDFPVSRHTRPTRPVLTVIAKGWGSEARACRFCC